MVRRFVLVGSAIALMLGGLLPSASAATHSVPCSVSALNAAIGTASNGDVLKLAPHCDYVLTAPFSGVDGLPLITASITIHGRGAT